MPFIYEAECCSRDDNDWKRNNKTCFAYLDVEGLSHEDCENQLIKKGLTNEEEFGWICPECSKLRVK